MKKQPKIILAITIIILLFLSYWYLPILPFQPRIHDGTGDHNLLKSTIENKTHADLICNTSSIIEHDPDFAKVYMAEKKLLLDVLVDGDEGLYARAKNIVDDYYTSHPAKSN